MLWNSELAFKAFDFACQLMPSLESKAAFQQAELATTSLSLCSGILALELLEALALPLPSHLFLLLPPT